ncbi:hypothetical protein NQ317_014974 [Molorchus minor]|uniref:Uncharacterized protein n=1 Tax=Molorchus minor TaxID=1323400 RepID=A0ABQ9J2K0_9CUCU|nr:hypothetical protein NQ317_014974 [Molorchus minor]
MAETGQEEGKQNIRIEGALFDPLDVHWIYLCCLGITDENFFFKRRLAIRKLTVVVAISSGGESTREP